MVGNSKEISASAERGLNNGHSLRSTVTQPAARPFGQRLYDTDNFKPTLNCPHYKFTLLLPVSEKITGEETSREVFTTEDLDGLKTLFRTDFGGATYLELKGSFPVNGDWVDRRGNVVIDWHVRIEVYTKKHEGALEYFEELKARLLQHVKEVRNMEQEEILIEIAEPDFVKTRSLGEIITKSEERLKNLKR